jgi:hypothetical protein
MSPCLPLWAEKPQARELAPAHPWGARRVSWPQRFDAPQPGTWGVRLFILLEANYGIDFRATSSKTLG